jgi:hypothetical protein
LGLIIIYIVWNRPLIGRNRLIRQQQEQQQQQQDVILRHGRKKRQNDLNVLRANLEFTTLPHIYDSRPESRPAKSPESFVDWKWVD